MLDAKPTGNLFYGTHFFVLYLFVLDSETVSYHVARVGLEPTILLPQPPAPCACSLHLLHELIEEPRVH